MFLRLLFSETDVGGLLFYILKKIDIKMIYPSIFQKFLTLSMHSSQSTNKTAANDSQIKLIIHDV